MDKESVVYPQWSLIQPKSILSCRGKHTELDITIAKCM